MRAARLSGSSSPSRRTVLRGALGVGTTFLASGCVGFSTTGAGGTVFLSTQFRPVAEVAHFRATLSKTVSGAVSYVTIEEGPFASQVQSQVGAGRAQMGLLGGSHSDLAPLAKDYLEDLTDVLAGLGDRGWPSKYLKLAQAGTQRTWYVPWAQASFVLAAHSDALQHLPPGADAGTLTYDQFLDWAIAARRANGNRPALGLPCGPKGLIHRFLQGYLLPSFTGGQISKFRSPEAVTAWQYLRELWPNCSQASTTYDFMQEPLLSGNVWVAFDHISRLRDAFDQKPDAFVAFPAPKGPMGRAFMPVLAGLAVPKWAPDMRKAKELIKYLLQADQQVATLRAITFFPVTDAALPADLSASARALGPAVTATTNSPDALPALLPVGLGDKAGQFNQIYIDTFERIALNNEDIKSVLDNEAQTLRQL